MRTLWGSLVRTWRERSGLSFTDVQQAGGVNRSLQHRYESGDNPPPADLDRVDQMAEIVRVPEKERARFRDISRLSRGELPPDVAQQEGVEEFLLPAINKARKARGE